VDSAMTLMNLTVSHMCIIASNFEKEKAVQVQPCILWVWLHSQKQKYCTQDHAYKNAFNKAFIFNIIMGLNHMNNQICQK